MGVGSHKKGFGDDRYRAIIQALISARKAAKLSQQDLADRLGRHQQFVSRYELGERRLDIIEFNDVALVLALDPATLLQRHGART